MNENNNEIEFRSATPDDIPALKSFLLNHGPNDWNYLPEAGVDQQFALMKSDQALAIIAHRQQKPIGLAISVIGEACPEHIKKYSDHSNMLFIGDVAVDPKEGGQGIGTKLLNQSILRARQLNLQTVYLERHEENLASAGMMRKAGFEIVETFHDPIKRNSGSRNSVVLKIDIN
jgi:ribosomal protein S18 acetylase RimI-like enzyme